MPSNFPPQINLLRLYHIYLSFVLQSNPNDTSQKLWFFIWKDFLTPLWGKMLYNEILQPLISPNSGLSLSYVTCLYENGLFGIYHQYWVFSMGGYSFQCRIQWWKFQGKLLNRSWVMTILMYQGSCFQFLENIHWRTKTALRRTCRNN